jgi:purine-cytosine permease-like protein
MLIGVLRYDPSAQKALEDRGASYAADILSFGGIIFSSCAGWAPVAADYNVRLPADTSRARVFFLTFFGLFIPIVLIEGLGATLMTITNPDYVAAFTDGGTGGLIGKVLAVWGGFGKFLLVLLALSVVANNMCAILFLRTVSADSTAARIRTRPRSRSRRCTGRSRRSRASCGPCSCS